MSPELVVATKSAAETRAVAAALAGQVVGGDLVLLTGDLGAGKTTFCQGFGVALGVSSPITSPTFTLHHRYEGRLVMHHLDVYRLEQLDETIELGLAELLDADAVTLIEWGDTIRPVLAPDYLEISLELGTNDEDRVLRLQLVGPRWLARRAAIAESVGASAAEPTGERGDAPC